MEIQNIFDEDSVLVVSQYNKDGQKWEKSMYVKVPSGLQTINFNSTDEEETQAIYCGANGFSNCDGTCSLPTSSDVFNGTKDKSINPQNAVGEKISERQFNYLLRLGKNRSMNKWDLDKESLNIFGVRLAYLTKVNAHHLIKHLLRQKAA